VDQSDTMIIAPFIRHIALAGLLLTGLLPGFAGVRPAAAAAGPEAAPVIAADMDVSSEAGRTILRIALSKAVSARAHVMERPDRVIVDLPEVTFRLPAETGRKREGFIASYRYGLFAPGQSRVVIDLAQPALVSRLEAKPDGPDGTASLTIELTKTDRETFRRAAADRAAAAAPSKAVAPAAPGDERPVIVLDPGHGGIDPGAAAGGGRLEKDIVFAYAGQLKRKLEATGRYRVLMTREHDIFIPLGERVRLARAAHADLFISIHADTISGGADVRGLTIYTGSERASDADSAKLADRENKADAVAGLEGGESADDVTDILQDLTQRETRAFSHNFASRLVGELDPVARLNKNPHRQAGFRVLRASDIPSVLLELGYLSSRKDSDLLMSEEWRDLSSGAIVTAVQRFFATRLANRGTAAVSP
jgi:N-acetylmuramoyl-L-alanine amidase